MTEEQVMQVIGTINNVWWLLLWLLIVSVIRLIIDD